MQILFAVAEASDPVCAIVKKLLAEFPQRDAQLIICPKRLGANAKVSQLAQIEPLAKHEILVISDADVRVPPDLLENVVAPCVSLPASDREKGFVRVGQANVGLINCFYQFANPTTSAMQWEAIAVNADFWSMVLQGASFRKLDFALGAVMATRRRHLAEIGGFEALADCLADDYQFGHRIAAHGHRIELCPVVVECWSAPMGWREVWRHQLRWARTIRVCQPAPYFFSIIANATLWPFLWLATDPSSLVLMTTLFFLSMRMITAADMQSRLTKSRRHLVWFWMVLVKDLLQAVLWIGAFAGNLIEWRGVRYHLHTDGNLKEI